MTFFWLKTAVFLLFAVPAAMYDWRHFRVPLWYVALGMAALLSLYVFHPFVAGAITVRVLKNPLLAVASSLVIYMFARFLTGGALGWGDVFFSVLPALFTGFPLVFFSIAFAALSGILFYLALSVRDSWRKKQPFIFRPVFAIPYVPFTTFGAVLAVALFRFF